MTHDINIPPEAAEAATNAVHEFFYNTHSWAFSHELAIAALRAGLAAWPGMEQMRRRNGQGKGFFLPLLQEPRDE